MTQYEQQVQHTGVFYSEDRSAIRWPYAAHGVCWLLLLVLGIAVTDINPSMSFVPAFGIMGVVLSVTFAVQNWPVGIRVGGDGIRIGAVRRRPEPADRQPWSDYQRWHAMAAPWDSVRRAAVITDRSALRDARSLRSKQNVINRVGVLSAPFTRAALLIEVDPGRVIVPDFHEPNTERPFWTPPHMTPFEISPVWYVPTRRPGALREALAQQASAFGGRSDPRLPAHLRLLFERADVTRA